MCVCVCVCVGLDNKLYKMHCTRCTVQYALYKMHCTYVKKSHIILPLVTLCYVTLE